MKELYVFCEGPTEQGFCSQVLQPHWFPQHDGLVHPIRIAHKRKKGVVYRGGVNKYQIIKDDIVRSLRANQRSHVLFTSMIDLYALPNDFPAKSENTRNPDYPRPYVEAIESAFGRDVGDLRFVPHLQLHEFETLIFSKPDALKWSFDGIDAQVGQLQKIAKDAGDIERINDTPTGAPSKRIIKQIPQCGDEKTTVGPEVTDRIGMKTMLDACSHFRDWVELVASRLEAL